MLSGRHTGTPSLICSFVVAASVRVDILPPPSTYDGVACEWVCGRIGARPPAESVNSAILAAETTKDFGRVTLKRKNAN